MKNNLINLLHNHCLLPNSCTLDLIVLLVRTRTLEIKKAQKARHTLYGAMAIFIVLPFLLLWIYGK